MRWLIIALALAGCMPPEPPLTPEQQQQAAMRAHCENVARLAKGDMNRQQRADSQGRPSGGYAQGWNNSLEQGRAYDVAFTECMWRLGQ